MAPGKLNLMAFDFLTKLIDTFFPMETVSLPFAPPPPPRPVSNAAPVTDDIVLYGGIPFKRSADSDGDDKRISNADIIRDASVKPGECPAHLNPAKYAELKRVWAKGTSAAQAEKLYEGKRGYKLRTLEKYWAAYYSYENHPQ